MLRDCRRSRPSRRAHRFGASVDRLEGRTLLSYGLDASFGNGGVVTTPFLYAGATPTTSQATAVAVSPLDGKVLVAGTAATGDGSSTGVGTGFALARYKPSGALDTGGFASPKGQLVQEFSTPNNLPGSVDQANAMVLLANGASVIGGSITNGNNRELFLAQYGANGQQSASNEFFDNNGDDMNVVALAVQPDKKVVVVGNDESLGKIVVARVDPSSFLSRDFNFGVNGANTSFAGNGAELISFSATAGAAAIQKVGAQQKIVIAGNSGSSLTLLRLNDNGTNDGALDTTFGTGGQVKVNLGGFANVNSMAVQNDGKILVAGSAGGFLLARFNTNGTLDTTFGTQGRVVPPAGNSLGTIASIQLQADGKIVAAGGGTVARFNANGTPDLSFGPNGQLNLSSKTGAIFNSVALDPNGGVVAVGTAANKFAVVHLTNRGGTPGDYTGAGRVNATVFDPRTSTFFIQGVGATQFGQGTSFGGNPVPLSADFRGTGKTDVAVFDPNTSTFYIQGVGAFQFGQGRLYGGDPIPVPADYGGVGHAQIAVFDPNTATFYIQGVGAFQFGQGRLYGGDPIPVPADYSGVGHAQLAVFDPNTSTFYIQGVGATQFGQGRFFGGHPIAVPADYTGVGHAQIAVFDPATSTFYIQGVGVRQFGQGTLYGGAPIPVPGDYAGTGRAQVAVFDPVTATFYVQGTAVNQFGQGRAFGGAPIPLPIPTAYGDAGKGVGTAGGPGGPGRIRAAGLVGGGEPPSVATALIAELDPAQDPWGRPKRTG